MPEAEAGRLLSRTNALSKKKYQWSSFPEIDFNPNIAYHLGLLHPHLKAHHYL